ncbi:VanZ family protein [Falsibacillus albus]|nr:VanZ family protein [Falsibacillus albus]
MKPIRVLLFALLIFVFTCSESFVDLFFYGKIHFDVNPHPNFNELFYYSFVDFQDPIYVLQKIGHMTCFFILTLLLYSWLKRTPIVFVIAVGYACLTEFLQIIFNRDGRIFDVFVDSFGILAALVIIYTGKQLRITSSNDVEKEMK